MIDREQVLHVAKLAALDLEEDGIAKMQGELSAILDHVARISKLDLEGVQPTIHVGGLRNMLRPDVPAPSLPREKALANAPDQEENAFRVPSPQAGA